MPRKGVIKLENKIEKQIDELVGALTDPIIVWPGGWMDAVPETLKSDITIYRLGQLMKGEEGVATWPEVCAYLMTVTLERPVSSEWVHIYMYAMTQYKGDKMPGDIHRDHLEADELRMLTEFRQWLWNVKVKRRLEKGRAERRQAREEAKASAPKQVELDLVLEAEYEPVAS